MKPAKSKPLHLEHKILQLLLWVLVPGWLVSLVLLFNSDASTLLMITIALFLTLSLWGGVVAINKLLSRQFTGVTNILESLSNGDFTSTLSPGRSGSAWSELQFEVNRLAKRLHSQRISSLESDNILDKLIEEFDIPLLVIDRSDALVNINQAGADLFSMTKSQLLGLSYHQLQLGPLAEAETGSLVEFTFPKRSGRWEVKRNVFRKSGSRLTLLLLNDLSRTLREEERRAWQRMLRVISHELNNSLSSITSIAETLRDKSDKLSPEQLQKSMGIIADRGYQLQKFTESYSQLAKLPEPQLEAIDLPPLIAKCCEIVGGEFEICQHPLRINADNNQIQQLFINIIKNAREASPAGATIDINWVESYYGVQINVIDNGTGIISSDNLFVPFYTTKPGGNGIGLYLCKQIAENHNGTLSIDNRQDATGCVVSLWIPGFEK